VVDRQNAHIADTLHLRDVAMATIFGFLYMGCILAPPGEYDCAAAMRPYVKLLWPLVTIITRPCSLSTSHSKWSSTYLHTVRVPNKTKSYNCTGIMVCFGDM